MLYNLERRESLHPYGKVWDVQSCITLLSVDTSLEEDEVDEDVELECPDEATATGEEGKPLKPHPRGGQWEGPESIVGGLSGKTPAAGLVGHEKALFNL